MIFIWGVSRRSKYLNFNQPMTCLHCGHYGSFRVYKTYSAFTFFFIPIFWWGTKYYVESTCCGKTYMLNPAIGKMIAKGQEVQILPEHLYQINNGRPSYGTQYGAGTTYGNSNPFGNANTYGNANAYGGANTYRNANTYGSANTYGNANIYGNPADNKPTYAISGTSAYAVNTNLPQIANATKICSRCRKETSANYAFCPGCGAKL